MLTKTIVSFFVVNLVQTLAVDVCNSKFKIESDLRPKDCEENTSYFPYTDGGNICFPSCKPITNEKCGPGSLPCPPGFKCNRENENCVIDEDSCWKYYNKYSDKKNPYLDAFFKPKCTKDGKWEAKQCKGEVANGRCFCYDEVGNKLFGQEWSYQADNMTCACSRRRAELLKDPTRLYVSLHCDRRGSFERLQCDSGQCWCVEPLTGKLNSPFVPESMMKFLPCYKGSKIGERYLRQCESSEYANAVIDKQLKIRGTIYSNLPKVSCDPDGSYSAVQIKSGSAYCTWRDNKPIGSYQANEDIQNINCNCARDMKYFEESGKSMQLKCNDIGGNYFYMQQTQDGKYYCVDNDGFKKHKDYLDKKPTQQECAKYLSY